jgi:hypothetical protein
MNRLCLLLVALVPLLPGCGWLVGSWAGRPAAEARRDSLVFSHRKHVAGEGTDCEACHGDITKSGSLGEQRALPREAHCLECHDRDDDCEKCHTDPKAPVRLPDRRLAGVRFSHRTHVDRSPPDSKEKGCTLCHAETVASRRLAETARPPMFELCGRCHRRDFGREDCLRCHEGLHESPARPLSLYDHGQDFLRRHGTAAKGGEAVCAHCHGDEGCAQCHARNKVPVRTWLRSDPGVERPGPHRGDFLTRHAVEARVDGKACLSCHEERSCLSCHERMGVASRPGGAGKPHPTGWLARGSGAFHGEAVRRDVLACAACHDQGAASNCVRCHRSGGPGGSPHPPNWTGGRDRSAPACAPCHR